MAKIDLNSFKNPLDAVPTGTVQFFITGTINPYKIRGMVVSHFSLDGTDIRKLVEDSWKVSFTAENTYFEIPILSKELYSSHYYLELESTDITISGTFTTTVTFLASEIKFIPLSRIGHINSDYNPIINNIMTPRPSKIYRVIDRFGVKYPIIPPLQEDLLLSTSTLAYVQDFNTYRKGSVNARYGGTKLTAVGTVRGLDVDGGRVVVDESKALFSEAYSGSITLQYGAGAITFSGSSFPIVRHTGDEPFKGLRSFKGVIQPYNSDSEAMKESLLGTTELVDLYFEPRMYIPSGSVGIVLADLPVKEPGELEGDIIYSGDRFSRVVRSKILSIDKGLVYTVNDRGRITLVD